MLIFQFSQRIVNLYVKGKPEKKILELLGQLG